MYRPLSEAFFMQTFCTVLPLPSKVRPLPLLPEVDEKSMTAEFLPEMLTPAGTFTAPDFTVPLMTTVSPFLALLSAEEREGPPFFTSREEPEEDELLEDEELLLEEDELLEEELPEDLLAPAEVDSNLNCWQASPL